MTDNGSRAPRRRAGYAWLAAGPVAAGAIAILLVTQPAAAATAPVGLGTASSFAVLAGQTVTNTGASIINGDLGVSPGTAVTGFPPGTVTPPGTIHAADPVAAQAQSDLTTAYNDAAGRALTANVPGFIGAGQSLAPGVYKASTSLEVGGALTLNAGGDPNAVWIFQVPSTLVTDSASSVLLTNGAQACNVFWQVGSSATLGTGSSFVGSILALTSITVQTGDTIAGRALARNGQVSLDDDTITPPTTCTTTTPTATPTPAATGPTPTPTPTPAGVTIPPITLPIGPITLPTGPITLPTGPITLPTGPVTVPTGPGPRPTGPGPRPTSPGPRPTSPGPRPSPTGTTPSPTGTATSPGATPTPTSPTPAPAPTSPAPGPAPAPTPVGGTFPVTG